MGAERGRRTHHRAQVARVGDAVQGGDQRQLPGVGGPGEQVVGMRVVVGAHPQRQALVQRAAGEPVEFGGAGLEHGHAPVGGELDGLADPLVVLHPGADVQGHRGHAGPQRLDHRVAPGDELGRVPGTARRSRGRAGRPERRAGPRHRHAGRAAGTGHRGRRHGPARGGGRRAPLRRVARPHGRGRGRPLALELAPSLAAGAWPRLARLGLAGPGRPVRSPPAPERPAPNDLRTSPERLAPERPDRELPAPLNASAPIAGLRECPRRGRRSPRGHP